MEPFEHVGVSVALGLVEVERRKFDLKKVLAGVQGQESVPGNAVYVGGEKPEVQFHGGLGAQFPLFVHHPYARDCDGRWLVVEPQVCWVKKVEGILEADEQLARRRDAQRIGHGVAEEAIGLAIKAELAGNGVEAVEKIL